MSDLRQRFTLLLSHQHVAWEFRPHGRINLEFSAFPGPGLRWEAPGLGGLKDQESPGDLDKTSNVHLTSQKVQLGGWVDVA